VAVLSIWYGEKRITTFDWGCLVFSLSAIPLWSLTSTPLYSVILISIIDIVAFLPTFRKARLDPGAETLLSYNIGNIKFLLALAALEQYNFVTVFYPAVVILSNVSFVLYSLYLRRVVQSAGPVSGSKH
jgi:hypothetical protein